MKESCWPYTMDDRIVETLYQLLMTYVCAGMQIYASGCSAGAMALPEKQKRGLVKNRE